VRRNQIGFGVEGSNIAAGDQLLATEDSIQVIQLQVVRCTSSFGYAKSNFIDTTIYRITSMTVITHSICTDIVHGCMSTRTLSASNTYADHCSMGAGDGRYIGQALNNSNPLRRDTVLIPGYSWLVLRFVTDNRECFWCCFSLALMPLSPYFLAILFDPSWQPAYGLSIAIWRGIWPQVS